MPEFIAVQCFKCNQYQVSQKRKDGKFNCKICGNKQSVRKIAARSGKAADIRKFVQQINLARGQAAEQYDDIHGVSDNRNEEDILQQGIENDEVMLNASAQRNMFREQCGERHYLPTEEREAEIQQNLPSKWAAYTEVQHQQVCQSDRTGLAHHTDNVEDNGEEESDFVTALPDFSVRRHKKRKRLATGNSTAAPDNLNITSSRNRPGQTFRAKAIASNGQLEVRKGRASNKSHPGQNDAADESGSDEISRSQRRPWDEPRLCLENEDAAGGKNIDSRWSRWDSSGTRSRHELQGDDLGGGLFTSLGGDEVVNEETF